MLRDIPAIYLRLFLFVCLLVLLSIWYTNSFQRDDDTLQLNDTVLSTAVSEVDQASRLYEGALLLSKTFEPVMWERLSQVYGQGDEVQFDYMFDAEDERFDNVEEETVSSPTYVIGGSGVDIPNEEQVTYMTGRPIQAVRVKVRQQGDNIGEWTYTSTIAVDAASRGGSE